MHVSRSPKKMSMLIVRSPCKQNLMLNIGTNYFVISSLAIPQCWYGGKDIVLDECE